MKFLLYYCLGCLLFSSSLRAQYQWNPDFLSIDSVDYENQPALYERVHWLTHQKRKSPSGWQIDYFVKKDSTLLEDIYIRISKGEFEHVYKGEYLLEYRNYFVPTYQAETTHHILLEHGCATDCSAITTLSKKKPLSSQTYHHVVYFNPEHSTLIHVTDSSYQYQNQFFQLKIVNLESNKAQFLKVIGPCPYAHLASCVERITPHPEYLEVVISIRHPRTGAREQVTNFVAWP